MSHKYLLTSSYILIFVLAIAGLWVPPSSAANILNYGTDGDDTQIDPATPDPVTYLQYGRAGNDTQFISGGNGNDWIEQNGGDGWE